ncbi:MAG: P1 family peptidase [Paracoccaceae bacterium]
MGGAPGTRDTDLLAPDKTIKGVDALVLSGGSAFGLDAASGVVDTLQENGKGLEVGGHIVPLVPAAILFDLTNGGEKNWSANPYPDLGREAYENLNPEFGLGHRRRRVRGAGWNDERWFRFGIIQIREMA